MSFNEEKATKLALRIVGDNPGCTTSFIKEEIERTYYFSAEDLEPLANRNDRKYTQIIRNLTSHFESNEFGRRVDRVKEGRFWKFTLKPAENVNYVQEVNEEVFEAIDDLKETVEILNTPTGYSSQEEIDNSSNRRPEAGNGTGATRRYKTDTKLAKTALERANHKCELEAIVPNRTHTTFKTNTTDNYTEAHHLIPMKAQASFGEDKNLDRIENIISLCPTCHRAVHYGTRDEKVPLLQALYNARKTALENCQDNITIDFDDLINDYYSK